ncbi:PorV/PorQ family protein [bacterium]|nr:PorV/PorQ family protein [bacterium]MBU1074351.1 PorV/PorQ family protein [bacterium]MBU1674198.1 PorV/PorQ family protein [bacterium]
MSRTSLMHRLTAPALGILVLSFCTLASAGTPGESGFLSLRTAVGAREAAMGGAGVALSRGAAAVYWNPALLVFEENGTDLLLQHQRMWGLFDKETASIAHRTDLGALGFMFSGFYAEEMERYEEVNVGVPLGTFRPYQVALGFSYARKISETFAAGAMIKLLHEEIDMYGDTGLAYDLSIAHKAIIEGLWFGASLNHFGQGLTLNSESYPLPTILRVGMAFDPAHDIFADKVTLAGDIVFPNDGNSKAHVGVEYRMVPALALRFGTKINYTSQGLTAGAGFTRGDITVSYAYQDALNDLGDGHRFALEMGFGSGDF